MGLSHTLALMIATYIFVRLRFLPYETVKPWKDRDIIVAGAATVLSFVCWLVVLWQAIHSWWLGV